MTRKINVLDHVTKYGYDLVGNRDYSLDPNGTVGDYDYYPNNLLQKMTLTNGEEVQAIEYVYDEAGYVMETNNGEVVTKYNTYADGYQPDPFGRIRKMDKVIDGQTFTVEYSYDVMGRVTGVKSPTGNWVNYNYNNLGQLISVPGYINQAPVYDEGGILESLTAANGITTSWEYDNNGRLTGLDYHHQSALVKGYDLGYDNTNNIVTKNDDSFNYDKLNQLVFANLKGKFENDPDEEEQLVGRTLSDYSGQNNLEVVAEQSKIIELDYAGGSIGVDLQGTVSVSRVELTPDSLVHRVNKNSLELYYSLDNYNYSKVEDWELVIKKHGKLMLVLDTPVSARYIKVKSYADERDNCFKPINTAQFFNTAEDIIQVYYYVTSRAESYSYDAAGNRLSETITQRNSVSRGYSYYSNSNLLKSNGKYGYVYDANGNLTRKGEGYTIAGDSVTIVKGDGEYWEYEYDLFNRLRRVIKPIENGTEVIEYTYDESGLRLKKESTSYEADEDLTTEKAPDQVVYYIFGQNGEVLYEQEDREYMEYIYVLGGHFARVDGNFDTAEVTRYFYHTDHLGSAVLVTDESGQTVWSSEYTPFGKIAMEEGILAKAAKFTGKDLDEDTGLYNYNARWYDQEIGRFITKDTYQGDIYNPQTLNLFTYTVNNPIKYIDPSGNIFLQAGARGEDVRQLQEYLSIEQTGVYDVPTLLAVNKFKDSREIGNTDVWHGAVGDYTYHVLHAEHHLLPVLSAQEFAKSRDIPLNDYDSVYYNWGKTSDGNISMGVGLIDVVDRKAKKEGRVITTDEELTYYEVNVSPLTEAIAHGLMGGFRSTIDYSRYSVKDRLLYDQGFEAGVSGFDQTLLLYSVLQCASIQAAKEAQWFGKNGEPRWPPDRGFKGGKSKEIALKPGARIDRYGLERGTFVSPEGTPYARRALAPGTFENPYNIYEVIEPVNVKAGRVAPWFGWPGGGIQYEFYQPIRELLEQGILRKVGP